MINKDIKYLNSLGYRGPKGSKHPEETQIEWDIEYRLKKQTPDKKGCFTIEFLERDTSEGNYFVYTIKMICPYKDTQKWMCFEVGNIMSEELREIPKLEAELFGNRL